MKDNNTVPNTIQAQTDHRGEEKRKEKRKVYPQRWLALGIFSLHEMTNNMMWIMFSPISTIAACYYDVSLFWINSLSWIFMVTYVVFLLPSTWFLEKFGLRATAIVGGCLNTVGAWVRFAGSGYTSFWLLMLGQFITSIPYLLETNACSTLSAVWFPPNERTFATTIFAVISAQFGVLISVLVTPFVITGGPNTEVLCNITRDITLEERYQWVMITGDQFLYYLLAQAILTSLTLPITFFIKEAPPTPPSDTARTQRDNVIKIPLYRSFIMAFKNIYFVAFLIVYGAFVAASASYLTVFQEVLYNAGYSHYQDIIGYLGSAISVASIVALIATSQWIDYSKRYYCTAVFSCVVATLFTIVLSVLIQFREYFYAVFVAATLTGGSLSLLGAVGLEYAVEMTYPVSEGVSASILNMFTMLFGVFMIIGVGQLVQHHLATYGMYLFSGSLLIVTVVMFFIRPDLKRKHLDNNIPQLHVTEGTNIISDNQDNNYTND